jgi:hypothetical protein
VMTIPTRRELAEAQASIRAEGRLSATTIALSMMCIEEPLTMEVVEKIASISGVGVGDLMGAFIAGLDLGLRVREKTEGSDV